MWQLRGNDSLLAQLDQALREGRYAHAYLIVGPPQVGKGTLAINIAQALNCSSPQVAPCGECSQCKHISSGQHADVLVIQPNAQGEDGRSRREIGIGDVREVHHQVNLKAYEGSHRVFIFDGAEHMSEEAGNALLKTLEEPPPQVVLILLASREEALLPTIRSRCRRLELRPLPVREVAAEMASTHSMGPEEAELTARLSMGRLGWALSSAEDPAVQDRRRAELERVVHLSTAGLDERFSFASELASLFRANREAAREVLNLWLGWWRDMLVIKEGAQEFIHNLDWSDSLVHMASTYTTAQVAGFMRAIIGALEALDQNANARLALEVLMLSLPEDGNRGSPVTQTLPRE